MSKEHQAVCVTNLKLYLRKIKTIQYQFMQQPEKIKMSKKVESYLKYSEITV